MSEKVVTLSHSVEGLMVAARHPPFIYESNPGVLKYVATFCLQCSGQNVNGSSPTHKDASYKDCGPVIFVSAEFKNGEVNDELKAKELVGAQLNSLKTDAAYRQQTLESLGYKSGENHA